jgi:hypothetical protein
VKVADEPKGQNDPDYDEAASEASNELRATSTRIGDGEQGLDTSVGFTNHLDLLTHNVDFGYGAGAAGFIGQMSEISWIGRAHRNLIQNSPSDRPSGIAMAQYSYFMDDEDVLAVDEDHVNALELPPEGLTSFLSETFFHCVQGAFDFTIREQFLQDLNEFHRFPHSLSWDQRRWLGLANIMWAIASKWLQMAGFEGESRLESHSVYYARARGLGLDHRVLFDHPNLVAIQALGLISFYLYVNGSMNRYSPPPPLPRGRSSTRENALTGFRAWALAGMAVRHATGLGLHLEVHDRHMNPAQLRERAHIWYSICNLEVALSEILGRQPSFALAATTVPIEFLQGDNAPTVRSALGTEEGWGRFLGQMQDFARHAGHGQVPIASSGYTGQGPRSVQFSRHVSLGMISHQISTEIYIGEHSDLWTTVHGKVDKLRAQLLEWEKTLPAELRGTKGASRPIDRTNLGLALYHQSLKMILYRPCLGDPQIADEGLKAQAVALGRECVVAAMSLIDLLPNEATAPEMYRQTPWWNIIHYLCQAMAVFTLELSLRLTAASDSTDRLEPYVRKVMTCLWQLTPGSSSAYKAWRVFRFLLPVLNSATFSIDRVSLPAEAYIPSFWTVEDEAALLRTFEKLGNG